MDDALGRRLRRGGTAAAAAGGAAAAAFLAAVAVSAAPGAQAFEFAAAVASAAAVLLVQAREPPLGSDVAAAPAAYAPVRMPPRRVLAAVAAALAVLFALLAFASAGLGVLTVVAVATAVAAFPREGALPHGIAWIGAVGLLLAALVAGLGFPALPGLPPGASPVLALGSLGAVAVGALFGRPDAMPVALLAADTTGGLLARRLLPAAVLVPAGVAMLRLYAVRADFLSHEAGLVLMTAFTVALLVAVVTGAALVLHRLDERRLEAEAERDAQAADLRRSNADLEQFAYVASHDLQEPLRMVSSYVQLIERRYAGRLDKDADEFIGFAVDGATRMQALINDLLAYSRVGSKFEPRAVPLEDALARVLRNLRVTLDETKAEVTHDPLPVVHADPSQVVQLLQNLVANGVKFRGEAPPRIHVSAAEDGPRWRITVADNGIGIDPAHHDRIFVLFQRLHTRDLYEGTGIGLAVARKIVERSGGRLWVESARGKGAEFHFTLPAEE